MAEQLKILIVEDSVTDAEIVHRLLKKENMNFEFRQALNKNEYLLALDQFQPDIILCDNSLPQFSGTEALEIIRQRSMDIPFILVTGTVSEEFAAGIIKLGADDYILKDRLARLPAAIDAAIKHRRSEKEKNDYRYALDESSIIVITDTNGIIKYANGNFCKISKYSAEELIGCHHRILNSSFHSKSFFKNLWIIIASGKIWRGEICNKAKDGRFYWVDMTIVPFLNEAGKPYQYLAVQMDITERKNAEEQLRKNAEALRASNIELERFAYVASHDLQEPLRMVSSFLGLLTKKYNDTLDEEGLRYIRFAVDGAERMKRLILDLLLFSRLENQNETMAPVDCNEVMNEVIENLHTAISESDAIIRMNHLPVFKGNKSQILQLFQNLVSNAIKYHNEKSLTIEISCEEKENHWKFCVKDNGIGIDRKYFDKIFVIFQQLHNKDEYAGTGIGLTVAKKIVQRHGGSIWVESEPGKGSSFFFTIAKEGIKILRSSESNQVK